MKAVLVFAMLCLLAGCSTNPKEEQADSSTSSESSTSFFPEEDALIYDVEDSEIVEQLIENILSMKQKKRDELTIQIYTLNDYEQRNIWLAEAVFPDEESSYWLYIKEADKLVEIDEQEFQGKQTSIQKQNHSELPIYEEDNL
ncbi:hypothetical protein [Enterococcus larvae]|uniref:hypothetical protein n=1 Tax=Enterococcus larvae TaxID=2794352 RepID=UPI003F36AB39